MILAAVAVVTGSAWLASGNLRRGDDLFQENVEVLVSGEDVFPCTSPKTWLGLGSCMNITSVMCKDDSGSCN